MTQTYAGPDRRSGRDRRVLELTEAAALADRPTGSTPSAVAERVDTHGNVRGVRAEDGSLVRLVAPGVAIGVGLAGLMDSAVFHHLLQWHHVTSTSFTPGQTTLPTETGDLAADGVVELLCLVAIAAGLVMLWMAGHRPHSLWRFSGLSLTGWVLVGWSLYNVLLMSVPALLLDRHHVNVVGGGQLAWDLLWAGGSLALLALGLGLAVQGRPRDTLHDDWVG